MTAGADELGRLVSALHDEVLQNKMQSGPHSQAENGSGAYKPTRQAESNLALHKPETPTQMPGA